MPTEPTPPTERIIADPTHVEITGVTARCPDCTWTMAADDDAEAADLLEVHRITKFNEAVKNDA